jgi:2-phosphoglycerate kinase
MIIAMIDADPGTAAQPATAPAVSGRLPKPVVLIGGTAGTGKSSLAKRLCWELDLDHRIGTGFIRAAVCSQTTPERDPELFSFTFRARDPVAHLRVQAERLQPAVLACIRRARDEGTSLVVEGPHLLPSMYAALGADAYVVLAAPDPVQHRERLTGSTHARREISDQDVRNARLIDAHLAAEAARHGVRRLTYGENFADIAAAVTSGWPPPGLAPDR